MRLTLCEKIFNGWHGCCIFRPAFGLEVCVPELFLNETRRDETGTHFPNWRYRDETNFFWSRHSRKFGKNSGNKLYIRTSERVLNMLFTGQKYPFKNFNIFFRHTRKKEKKSKKRKIKKREKGVYPHLGVTLKCWLPKPCLTPVENILLLSL